jgi:uncharacterized membrane protein (DUF373 family)
MDGHATESQGTRHRERGLPYTGVNRLSRRALEIIQDVIVVALILVLFVVMGRTLVQLTRDTLGEHLDFRTVIAEVLFMLVMVELVRLLLVYLREHHVAVDFMVELGIVSTLREVVLNGVVELHWEQIVAIASFLLALGLLLRFGDLRLEVPRASGQGRMRITSEREQTVRPVRQPSGAE